MSTAGRVCICLAAAHLGLGCFIFDFNETHVYNPRWPPHARFHNGQTMSTGASLALLTLYYTFRKAPPTAITGTTGAGGSNDKERRPRQFDRAAAKDSVFTAAIFGSVYWVCGLSGILYPGSVAMDPEFGEGFPQLWLFGGTLVLNWLGWWLETNALDAY